MNYSKTGAKIQFATGDTTFILEVKQHSNKGHVNQKNEYVVFITQITKLTNVEGCEDLEDFKCTFKCVCLNSPTEHSALHFAGKKYIKNWNTKHRIGKDYPLN